MNAFATAPRYLLRPLELWRKRHKILFGRRLSYTLIQKLNLQERFKVRYYGAYFHPFPSSLSLALWLFGERFRSQDMQLLLELVRPGDTFVDIGANIGTHSICLGARLSSTTQIYSFEPHPRIFGYMLKNIDTNNIKNIHPFNVALGESEGTILLSNSRLDDRNHVASPNEQGGVSVPMKTLDSFQCDLNGLPTIKIDVEGYELSVLKGGERTLSRGRFLYIEVGDRHSLRFGYSAQQLMEFLYQTGWRMFRFEEQKHLVEVTPRYHPPDVENLVCARSPEESTKRSKTYTVQMR
jgi:FkbM family methyltransferase